MSLTSQLGKVFESILRDSIVQYLEGNNLLNNSQHGFRRGRSCLTNLLIFLDKVTRMVDEGNDMDVIYLDFAKAFDKVPHRRLLVKLRNHGINGKLLGWIEAWLSDRRQRVRINGHVSNWRDVTSGVPQGSVLGPVLFLLFIDDIDAGLLSHILKFADDTKVFNTADHHQDLQSDLLTLVDWSKKWQMEFNVSKCKVLHVGANNPKTQYLVDGHCLKSVQEEKDLGVVVSADLKSSRNCHAAYCKANQVLGMMKRTITNKGQGILLPLYKSLVRPLVEYCTPAWSPHYKKDKNLIEKIQHRFTRLRPGMSELAYSDRLDRLKLWTLEERRNRADLIELFKIQKGLSGIRATDLFEPDLDGRTRGHSL